MKAYIGIDLGGTNIRVAKVSENGEILQQFKSQSFANAGPDVVLDNLIQMVKQIDNYEECLGIGIGVPGPVDSVSKRMVMATNLKGFENYPIVERLQEHFKMPIFVDNDANVTGLAEALVGAGKALPVVYYVTISTGIGGALVINGQVISGEHGYAGEIANLVVRETDEKINDLNLGAVENEASGTALLRKARQHLGFDPKHAGEIFELAEKGDVKAQKIVDEFIEDLARMFSLIAHVCNPWAFIIGGGVMQSKDYFLEKVEERFKQLVHKPMRETRFLCASLPEPGVIGAAMLPVSKGL